MDTAAIKILSLFAMMGCCGQAIEIGFTLPRIYHVEQFRQFHTFINKSGVSEETFHLQIEISPGIGHRATPGEDFSIGSGRSVLLYMSSSESSIPFGYQLLDDLTPESQETFQLIITPATNSPPFNCSVANGCYQQVEIVIQDDDVVVVGFVDTLVEVNETDGQATLNVSISSPQPEPTLRFEIFSLNVASMEGSAGSDSAFVSMHSPIPGVDDFPQIYSRQPFQGGAFYIIFDDMAVSRYQQFEILNETFNDTHRWQTFTFPIYVDDVPEDVEELNLTLSLLPDPTLPPGSVNVTPAVATVRILDLSLTVLGYVQTDVTLTVIESDGVVHLTVGITVPTQTYQIEPSFYLLVNTFDGTATAPGDYGALTNFRLGPFNNHVRQHSFNVSIVNDNIPEDVEMFNATLTLDPADRARLGNHVRVSPEVATVTVQDNDDLTVGYVHTAVSVLENEEVAQLTVAISIPPGAVPIETSFSLLVNTVNGAATAPGDYGALTSFRLGPFNNHVRQHSFNVSIVNDNIPEDAEMFNATLTLDPADQARLGNRVTVSPEVATVTVQDNDVVVVGFKELSYNVDEDDAQFQVCVVATMPTQSEPLNRTFTLSVSTSPGTADESDFTAIVKQDLGPFSNRQRQHCFFVEITDDVIPENLENLFLNLAARSGEVLERVNVNTTRAEVIINDNDPPDGSPLNLAVQSVNSTSLTLSWEPPSLTHQNGGHFNYTLTCISPADSGLRPLISVFTTAGAHTLNGLMPATLYACSVFAANLYGHSPPANVSAMTDGTCIKIFQLLLGEVNNCTEWRFQNTEEKLADITSSIISAVNSRCQCSLAVNHINAERFLCTNDQQVVLYRAELSRHADCAQVLFFIEQWVNEDRTSILVQGNSTALYPNCPIEVDSTTQRVCLRFTVGTDSGNANVGGTVGGGVGGAVGGVVLIGIIMLAAVIAYMCIYRKKQRSMDVKSNEAYSTVTNTEMKSNEAYGVFHHGTRQQHNETHQMPPLSQPPNIPPLPPNYGNLNPPMVCRRDKDASYVMISVKQEALDEAYKEVNPKEEHFYETVGASQMPTEDI